MLVWKVNDLIFKIISVTPTKKNKSLFHVALENGKLYDIHQDHIFNFNIKHNTKIAESVIILASNETEKDQIKSKIILLLSYRSRSKKELKDYFLNKKYKISNILEVFQEMEDRAYLNDSDFAKMYATNLIKEKKLGKYLVEQKLAQHEIDRSIMDPIITQLYDKYPVDYLIDEILKKKKWSKEFLLKNKIKIINHLKRKGYEWDDIKSIFDSK